ncbi:hypothetical protein O999_22760 [Pseudomonas putida LF54]|nr:hypothetical protein O999_22760 [Pseudomonas putida LF54]
MTRLFAGSFFWLFRLMKIMMARMITKVFQGVNARYKTLRNQHLRINLV